MKFLGVIFVFFVYLDFALEAINVEQMTHLAIKEEGTSNNDFCVMLLLITNNH
jgi:hypothetical protein